MLEDRLARLSTALRRLPEWAVAAGIVFAIVFLVFGRLLLRPQLMIWGSDFSQFYFWEGFTRAELAAGRLPLWNPYFFSGYPSLANPQTMVFYPLAALLRLLPISYAFGAGIALHVGWAGLGMYWLGRKQGLGRTAAHAAGLAFMLGGVVVPHISGGHLEMVYTLAWLPWAILGWQQMIAAPGLKVALLAGLVMAMMTLGGAIKVLVCAGVMVALILIVHLWQERSRLTRPYLLKLSGALLLPLVLAFGLAAPQLLPTLEFASLSSRAVGLPANCTTALSLLPRELLFAGYPQLPFDTSLEWERHSYIGAIGLALAMLSLFVNTPTRSPAWKPSLILMGAAGVLLSLGPAVPFYGWLHSLPIASLVRQPFTFVVLFAFAGAGLAGLGCQWVLDSIQSNRSSYLRWAIIVLLIVAGVVIDIGLYRLHTTPTDFSFYGWVNWLALFNTPRFVAAAMILLWQFGGRRWLTATAIAGLLLVDMWLFAYGRISFLPAQLPQAQADSPYIDIQEGRILTTPYTFSNHSMAVGTGNAQGYAPIVVETYRAFNTGGAPQTGCPSFENAEIDGGNHQLLGLLSVQAIVDTKGQVLEIFDPAPRIRWVSNASSVASSTAAIIATRDPAYDPTQFIHVEGVTSSNANGTGGVQITNYQPQSVTLEVDATSDGWVYLNDVWYPGWVATVNGQVSPLVRANGTFRALPVGAGHSVIQMTFDSLTLKWGFATGAIAWVVWLALFPLAVRNKPNPITATRSE